MHFHGVDILNGCQLQFTKTIFGKSSQIKKKIYFFILYCTTAFAVYSSCHRLPRFSEELLLYLCNTALFNVSCGTKEPVQSADAVTFIDKWLDISCSKCFSHTEKQNAWILLEFILAAIVFNQSIIHSIIQIGQNFHANNNFHENKTFPSNELFSLQSYLPCRPGDICFMPLCCGNYQWPERKQALNGSKVAVLSKISIQRSMLSVWRTDFFFFFNGNDDKMFQGWLSSDFLENTEAPNVMHPKSNNLTVHSAQILYAVSVQLPENKRWRKAEKEAFPFFVWTCFLQECWKSVYHMSSQLLRALTTGHVCHFARAAHMSDSLFACPRVVCVRVSHSCKMTRRWSRKKVLQRRTAPF